MISRWQDILRSHEIRDCGSIGGVAAQPAVAPLCDREVFEKVGRAASQIQSR